MSKPFLFVEKYRPQNLDDVIIPSDVKEKFQSFVKQGQIPNLLLSSPSPGTGKTTTAHALCNELGIKPLFINASMNNSIDDIRMTVVQYATTVSLYGDSTKVVILDECERLSPAAQDSLKGLIEQVHSNCRFILTANTKSRIIEPLQSRCISVDFVYTKQDTIKLAAQMLKRVFEILDKEGITYDKQAVAAIVKKYAPDNRKILQTLQNESANGNIDIGVLGKLNQGDTNSLVEAMKGKKFADVKQFCFDNADQMSDEFYGKLFKVLENTVNEQSIPNVVLVIGEYQKYHSVVPDRFLHFLALCTEIMMQVQFK